MQVPAKATLLMLLIAVAGTVTAFAKTPYEAALDQLDVDAYADAVPALVAEVGQRPSAAAYHNLALAYLGTQQNGEAAWAAASATALGGVSGDAQLNERIADLSPAELRPLELEPLVGFWRKLSTLAPGNLWAAVGLIGMLLSAALLSVALFRRAGSIRDSKGLFVGGTVLAVLSLVFVSLAYQQSELREAPVAAVLSDTALYASASPQSEELRSLPAGVQLTLGEHLGELYAVVLPTGEAGWVPEQHIRQVLSKD